MRPLTSGILLAALSVTMYSTGMVLEKLATRRLPSIHARRGLQMVATLARDPLWLLGFVLLVLGLGTQVLALTLAPISIVQAVAACGIALFLVLSHFVLGERLSKFEYAGIVAILFSLVLLGLSVDPSDDVVAGSTSLLTIFGVAIPAVMVGVFLFLLTDRLNLSKARNSHLRAPLFGLSSGLLYGVAALGVKEVSTIVKQHGLVDGIPRVLESPAFYLFLASTVLGFLVFQTALQRTTASVFVPVNNVTSSCYFIIAGTVLFHEHLPRTAGPLVLRLGAFAMILLGLMILAVSRSVVTADTGQLIPDHGEGSESERDVVTEAERVLGGHDGDDDAERELVSAGTGGSRARPRSTRPRRCRRSVRAARRGRPHRRQHDSRAARLARGPRSRRSRGPLRPAAVRVLDPDAGARLSARRRSANADRLWRRRQRRVGAGQDRGRRDPGAGLHRPHLSRPGADRRDSRRNLRRPPNDVARSPELVGTRAREWAAGEG